MRLPRRGDRVELVQPLLGGRAGGALVEIMPAGAAGEVAFRESAAICVVLFDGEPASRRVPIELLQRLPRRKEPVNA